MKVKLYYINFILLNVFGFLVYLSGFALLLDSSGRFSYRRYGGVFMGIGKHVWLEIHIISSLILLALIIIHLILN